MSCFWVHTTCSSQVVTMGGWLADTHTNENTNIHTVEYQEQLSSPKGLRSDSQTRDSAGWQVECIWGKSLPISIIIPSCSGPGSSKQLTASNPPTCLFKPASLSLRGRSVGSDTLNPGYGKGPRAEILKRKTGWNYWKVFVFKVCFFQKRRYLN